MIKLVESNFDRLNELGIFPSTSFIIFFLFFIIILVVALRMKKNWSDYMSHLPLDLQDEDAKPTQNPLNEV